MAESNLTIAAALVLVGSAAPQDKAKGLRLLSILLRLGVTMPPEAIEAIAQSLDGYADSLPKSGKQGGTPPSASNFLGYVTQVLMQELGVNQSEAIEMLLEYLDEHRQPLKDTSTIRRMHKHYAGVFICEPEKLEGVTRVLAWAKTRQDSA